MESNKTGFFLVLCSNYD